MQTKPLSFVLLSIVASAFLIAGSDSTLGGIPKNFFQNQDLNDGNNYSPAGTPTDANDVLLTTSSSALALNAANLAMGSLNQFNNMAYVISNNTAGSTNSLLALGSFNSGNLLGGDPNDLIYLDGATSSLTIQGSNGGTGSGVLRLGTATRSGNFDVAQAGATLNIFADLLMGVNAITKTGAGTLNFSGGITTGGGGIAVNSGTVNFLPGTSLNSGNFRVSVNNLNTGVGSDVSLNIRTSVVMGGLNGTLATPSSGTNTATVNLIGAATQVTITSAGSYAGTIAGTGSVLVEEGASQQTFSGNNTYSGTTSVISGTLRIDGVTSGQGNYNIADTGTLTGTGTIGLKTNGTIMLGGGQGGGGALSPGSGFGIGTLHVTTSGKGGVIFGNHGDFEVDVAGAGSSDLLAIAGGSIDLTSSTDRLFLNSLAGAFDGSSYTIATFDSNIGVNTFNNIFGLPGNYIVSYTANSIMLLPIPEPSTWFSLLFGCGVLFSWRRCVSTKRSI